MPVVVNLDSATMFKSHGGGGWGGGCVKREQKFQHICRKFSK